MMLNNVAYRDYVLEMLSREAVKDSDHINPVFFKYLVEERDKMQVKSLKEYSILCINQKLATTSDCRYVPIPQIKQLELPKTLKDDLNNSGLYGFDIQSKLNQGLKRELDKDDLDPSKVKIWLDLEAKIDAEVKSKADSGLKRMIEANNPIFAKFWLDLGGMIADFQQKIDKGLQDATRVYEAKAWCKMGASVDNKVQLKLNEWLKEYLERENGTVVNNCLNMGATIENLQQSLDDCMSSMLCEDKPDSLDIWNWKKTGANIKPEFQTILDSNLERVAEENNSTRFEFWVKLGANKTDKCKQLMNLAAQSYANRNLVLSVMEWVDLGANNPYSQAELNTMFQTNVQNDQPLSASAYLQLGAKVSPDLQAELNARLLRAINNNQGALIEWWLKIGARLSPELV